MKRRFPLPAEGFNISLILSESIPVYSLSEFGANEKEKFWLPNVPADYDSERRSGLKPRIIAVILTKMQLKTGSEKQPAGMLNTELG